MPRSRVSPLLVTLLASLLVGVAWFGVWALGQANRMDAALRIATEVVRQIERDDFARAEDSVNGLAHHPEIERHAEKGGAANAIEEAILLQARLTIDASIVMILDRRGEVISCSSTSVNLVGQNYAFRPYFNQALRGSHVVYGAIGVTTGRRGFFFSAPIGPANAPLGVAVAKVELERIEQTLGELPQPALLVSSDHVVFATNRGDWLYRSTRPLSHVERERLVQTRQFAGLKIDALPFDTQAETISLGNAQYTSVQVPLEIARDFRLILLDPIRDYPLTRPQLRFVMGAGIAGVLLCGLIVALMLANARRANAEHHLRRTESHLAQTLDSLADAVFAVDASGQVTRVNPAAVQMTGVEAAAAIGRPLREVLSGALDVDGLLESSELSVSTPLSVESRIVRADGQELRIVGRMTRMRGSCGELLGSVFVARDVTVESRLREQLQQANKMEAIGRLAGGVAHDFNNLLTMIQGNAELLVHKLERQPLQEFAREVVRAAARAADMTRQLLAFSRKASLKAVAVDLHLVLDEAVSLFTRGLDPRIRLYQERHATATVVYGDATQLQSALLNLFINARDAMPNGGRLSITTRNREKQAYLPGRDQAERGLELIVEDEGIGIAESMKEHIFEPFFTTKSSGHGTGLGLAAVYGCVQSHHGTIDVESQLGEGTRFTIWLPIVDQVPEAEADEQLRPSDTGGRILVVDTDTALRSLTGHALVALGYHPTVCVSLQDALLQLEHSPGTAVAIVLDRHAERWTTKELVERIRAVAHDLPILLLSALPEDGKDPGIHDSRVRFLDKPYRVQELGKALDGLLGHKR